MGIQKVKLFNHMSLDGFFEGPEGGIGWVPADEELNDFSHQQMSPDATLLFGRVTYQLMADYWQSQQAKAADPFTAEYMSATPKIVFSRTLQSASWSNTRLVRAEAAREIRKLKEQPGNGFTLLGSSNLASSLLREGLIDEVVMLISPVLLAKGRPHFHDLNERVKLNLIRSQVFHSGIVLLDFEVLKP